jgi:hypothetical protein
MCAKLIESFNLLERFQQRNGRGVRPGLDDSAWTEMDISRLSDAGFLASSASRSARPCSATTRMSACRSRCPTARCSAR